MTLTNILALIIFTVMAIAADIWAYHLRSVKSGYSPNLQLWGLGFLFGLCAVFTQILGTSISQLQPDKAGPGLALPQNIALLLVPAVVVVVSVLAIVRICRHE